MGDTKARAGANPRAANPHAANPHAANPHRGEVGFTHNGERYVLRPSYQAMAQIEAELGLGVVPLANRLLSGNYGVRETVAILHATLIAGGRDISAEEVGELIADAGLQTVFAPTIDALTNFMSGGQTPKKSRAASGRT